jgi:hypothetical protein
MSGVDDSVVAEPSLDLTPTIDPAHFERAEQQKRARKITFATFGQIESGSKHPWLHDRA